MPCTDTAFKQQRLKAWQPILTPRTVLPILLIIGLIEVITTIVFVSAWIFTLLRLRLLRRLLSSVADFVHKRIATINPDALVVGIE